MKTIFLAIVGKRKTDLIIEKDWQKLEELQKSFPDGEFYTIYTVQGDVGDLVELALKTYLNHAAINARICREAGI